MTNNIQPVENKTPVKMDLESKAYAQFCVDWNTRVIGNVRYGQAFYDFFKLYKLSDQAALNNLYLLDGDEAKVMIAHQLTT